MKPTDRTPGDAKLEPAASIARFAIWPHRSLDRRGRAALLGFVAITATIVVLGSPVSAVLPLLAAPAFATGALWLALWSNNRAGRRGEMIDIGPDIVRFTRLGPRGPEQTIEFATGWVRVATSSDRRVAHRITLAESGRTCSVGECLSPEERKALAAALMSNLEKARGAARLH